MDLLEQVRKILNGDESSWEQFVPEFNNIGWKTFRTFRLSIDDQTEILSQALSKVYAGGLKNFHGKSLGELVVYLKHIVRNEALTFIKKQEREELNPEIDENVPSGQDMEDTLAEEECLRLLEEIIQKLPFYDKELYMGVLQGIKLREIAEQIGEPLGTVGGKISRLKERIRENLRDHGCL